MIILRGTVFFFLEPLSSKSPYSEHSSKPEYSLVHSVWINGGQSTPVCQVILRFSPEKFERFEPKSPTIAILYSFQEDLFIKADPCTY